MIPPDTIAIIDTQNTPYFNTVKILDQWIRSRFGTSETVKGLVRIPDQTLHKFRASESVEFGYLRILRLQNCAIFGRVNASGTLSNGKTPFQLRVNAAGYYNSKAEENSLTQERKREIRR